jgi:hypothetical protein
VSQCVCVWSEGCQWGLERRCTHRLNRALACCARGFFIALSELSPLWVHPRGWWGLFWGCARASEWERESRVSEWVDASTSAHQLRTSYHVVCGGRVNAMDWFLCNAPGCTQAYSRDGRFEIRACGHILCGACSGVACAASGCGKPSERVPIQRYSYVWTCIASPHPHPHTHTDGR